MKGAIWGPVGQCRVPPLAGSSGLISRSTRPPAIRAPLIRIGELGRVVGEEEQCTGTHHRFFSENLNGWNCILSSAIHSYQGKFKICCPQSEKRLYLSGFSISELMWTRCPCLQLINIGGCYVLHHSGKAWITVIQGNFIHQYSLIISMVTNLNCYGNAWSQRELLSFSVFLRTLVATLCLPVLPPTSILNKKMFLHLKTAPKFTKKYIGAMAPPWKNIIPYFTEWVL